MILAFSKDRNVGGSYSVNGNPKAESFVGTGLEKWSTGAVTKLQNTFLQAQSMNADLGGWKVSRVTDMKSTFNTATKFVGTGLEKWTTGSVTSLRGTFRSASSVNADLGSWDTAKVTTMNLTFYKAVGFAGTGVSKWHVAKVTTMDDTFFGATSLTSCNKRTIADAWASNTAFTYDTDWATDMCPCIEGKYKDGTCKDCLPGTYTNAKDQSSCTGTECVVGTFGPAAQVSVGDATCSTCGAGTFADHTGTTTCKPKSVTPCGAGQGYTEGTASSDSDCAPCDDGYFSSSEGTEACTVHSTPPCSKGHGSVAGTAITDASCAPCSSGKYSVETDSSPCKDNTCPTGKFLGSGANEEQVCSSTCVAGKYVTEGGTRCSDCPSGTYTAQTGQLSCIGAPCVAGKFGPGSQTGPTTPVVDFPTCPNQTHVMCNERQAVLAICANGNGKRCQEGTVYRVDNGKCYKALTACPGCLNEPRKPPKHIQEVDCTSCTSCADGKYSTSLGSTACASKSVLSCGTGLGYSAGSAILDDASCVSCTNGSFSAMNSAEMCKPFSSATTCEPGTRVVPGTSRSDVACESCPVGTFSAKRGERVCVQYSFRDDSCGANEVFVAGDAKTDSRCRVDEARISLEVVLKKDVEAGDKTAALATLDTMLQTILGSGSGIGGSGGSGGGGGGSSVPLNTTTTSGLPVPAPTPPKPRTQAPLERTAFVNNLALAIKGLRNAALSPPSTPESDSMSGMEAPETEAQKQAEQQEAQQQVQTIITSASSMLSQCIKEVDPSIQESQPHLAHTVLNTTSELVDLWLGNPRH